MQVFIYNGIVYISSPELAIKAIVARIAGGGGLRSKYVMRVENRKKL